jgi:hypothetical protein
MLRDVLSHITMEERRSLLNTSFVDAFHTLKQLDIYVIRGIPLVFKEGEWFNGFY